MKTNKLQYIIILLLLIIVGIQIYTSARKPSKDLNEASAVIIENIERLRAGRDTTVILKNYYTNKIIEHQKVIREIYNRPIVIDSTIPPIDSLALLIYELINNNNYEK